MNLPSSLTPALRAAALITQMTLVTMAGAGLGFWLDGWMGTSPLFILVLVGLGFIGGIVVAWWGFSQAQDIDDEPPTEAP
ncbi:MAG: AtpZ/AtpI family protein [Deltaproteobacteria bacterium]|nr:MAG: AtpZ/AtpI family protein [Deltaproteobacteria bacterium]